MRVSLIPAVAVFLAAAAPAAGQTPFLRPRVEAAPPAPAPPASASKAAPAQKAAPRPPPARLPIPGSMAPPSAPPISSPAPPRPVAVPVPAPTPPPVEAPAPAPPPRVAAPSPAPAALAPRPAVGTPAPAAPASRTAHTVMIINSSQIADSRTGVKQLARISAQLTREFAPRTKTLEDLKASAEKAQKELAAATAPSPQLKAQIDRYLAEEKAYETAYNARSNALVAPVQRQVNEALQIFANTRGATVVIDGARFNESVLMLQPGLNPNTLDLTRAFIDSYNATHP